MKTVDGASGLVYLFTADGGPGQERWHNMRLSGVRLSGDALAVVMVNGDDVPITGGSLYINLTASKPKQSNSTHVLLTTGDVVSAQVYGSMNLRFSDSVDTEEIG